MYNKVYGLIGYPLIQSFSKKYFTEKFKAEGLSNSLFELFPLNSIREFPAVIQNSNNLQGLAVTIPYKEQVIRFLDETDNAVDVIKAVNCIKITNGKLKGYNTDITGFERSFVPLLQPHHTKALILGSGGASKAVQFVLNKVHIPFLIVTRQQTSLPAGINYEMITEQILHDYPVIINCSPVGMVPNEDTKPLLPYHAVTPRNFLYDLVYKPEETLFLKEGKAKGALVKNGFEMLIIQAEENWRIWNE
jgi:shikimate dehydrogenase